MPQDPEEIPPEKAYEIISRYLRTHFTVHLQFEKSFLSASQKEEAIHFTVGSLDLPFSLDAEGKALLYGEPFSEAPEQSKKIVQGYAAAISEYLKNTNPIKRK